METQERVKTIYSGDCNIGTSYTNWGTTRHMDVPVSKNGNNFVKNNRGCSTNEDAHC